MIVKKDFSFPYYSINENILNPLGTCMLRLLHMNIVAVAPIGMLFVRSKDGISHNPLEYSSDEDIVIATNIFYDTVVELEK